MFSDFYSRLFTHFSLIYLSISFRFVFFCLVFFQKAHAVCFLTSILAFSHTFLFSTCQSASGLCFYTCFPFKKHMPCVFCLQFSLLYTLFSYLPVNRLPVCVFLLAFLFKKTYRVFSDFYSRLFTHFSLIYLPFSFRFVFFQLAFLFKKNFLYMCFKHTIFPFSSYS